MTKAPAVDSIVALYDLLADLPGPDAAAQAHCRERDSQLTKPAGSLGRLEDIALHLAAWQGRHPPRAERVAARIFAGNHGVTVHGVSAFPSDVTAQMVANFAAGGAAINQLCRTFDIDLRVEAIALDRPTADFTAFPAMSEADFLDAFSIGIASVAPDIDVLVLGEMGIGNTTAAAALCHGLFGGTATDWVGRGTGVDDGRLIAKIVRVEQAVERANEQAAPEDPIILARSLGGRELAAIAGAVVAARRARVPVILDGYVCTAAAAVLHAVRRDALDHCLAGHLSTEPGHARLLERLGLQPLLTLGMRLGEGSGAALAAAVVRAAVACHTGMATFGEAGVAGKEG